MKVYTRTGDKGTTSLVGGTRIDKSDPRLDAYGTVDELNSWLGYIRSLNEVDRQTRQFVTLMQNRLFDLGCDLATERTPDAAGRLNADIVSVVEAEIDRLEESLPRHNRFVLPGGAVSASAANIARTVCRRAERIMTALPADCYPGADTAVAFVNRLSDYLFVLGRHINHATGTPETYWNP